MTDPVRSALRQGLAVSCTGLLVAALHVPMPLLALLAAQLIGGFACGSYGELLRRIAAALAGSLCGLLVLVAAPDQQWVSLPLFAVATGWGTVLARDRLGAASGILFGMGVVAAFSAGIVEPRPGVDFAFAHAAALIVAALAASAFAAAFIEGSPENGADPPRRAPGDAWLVGIAPVLALVAATALVPPQATVATVAGLATSLGLAGSGSPALGQRALGGALGMVVTLAFLVVVIGAGNDAGVYLGALALVFGAFEWLAMIRPARAAAFRQAAAMFAVAATILPQPDQNLSAPMARITAVGLGMASAMLVFALVPGGRRRRGAK